MEIITLIACVILGLSSISAHELGHYYAMRRYGIAVSHVSLLGIPVRWLPCWRWKRGDTEWLFSPLLPIAAFVKPADQEATGKLPLWDQIHIYSNGVTVNLAFTLATFGLSLSAHIAALPEATAFAIIVPSAVGLAGAGIMWLAQRYIPALLVAAMPVLAFLVLRGIFSSSPGEAVDQGAGGPIALATLFGEAQSLRDVFLIPAFVSLNLAAFNMLPIPPLDGGQILVAVARRTLGEKVADVTTVIGVLAILVLIVYSLTLDGIRVFRWFTE